MGEVMKTCKCVEPDLYEDEEKYAKCKKCGHFFNTAIWKAHWKDRVDTAIAKNQIGRNDPCPCKSGKKYKKCCIPTRRRVWIKKNPPPPDCTESICETMDKRERRIESETNKKS
jgi:hypothetical protein